MFLIFFFGQGEIDIIEGVNDVSFNSVALHTSGGEIPDRSLIMCMCMLKFFVFRLSDADKQSPR